MYAFVPLVPISPTPRTTTISPTPHSIILPRLYISPSLQNTHQHTLCAEPPSQQPQQQQRQPQPIPHRLARAFIEACQPGQKPYAVALRDFCRTTLAAYCAGYTLHALNVELGVAGTTLRLPVLKHDEVELRTVWLTLVYKTLRALGYSGGGEELKIAEREQRWQGDGMGGFVSNIVSAVRAGYDMKQIQLEQQLAQGGEARSALESAVLGQSTRLVVTTIAVADEELREERGE